MLTVSKPFLALTAKDLMTCPVELIRQEISLRTAARMLSQAHISGAPVVDAAGRCVGVLSATDFIHWAEECGTRAGAESSCVCSEWQVMDMDSIPEEEVRWHMTRDPVTASPQTDICTLARIMLDAHIHRVVIIDEQDHPVGIVTTTDILAALAEVRRTDIGAEAATVF